MPVDVALALGVPKERINTVVDFTAAKEKGAKTMGTKQAGGVPALQELAELAAWLGLGGVLVTDRGDLAADLEAAVR